MAVFVSLPEKPRVHCVTGVLMAWIQGQPWDCGTVVSEHFLRSTRGSLVLTLTLLLPSLAEAIAAGAAARVALLADACIPLKQDDYHRDYDPLVSGSYEEYRRLDRQRWNLDSMGRKEPPLPTFDLTGDGN